MLAIINERTKLAINKSTKPNKNKETTTTVILHTDRITITKKLTISTKKITEHLNRPIRECPKKHGSKDIQHRLQQDSQLGRMSGTQTESSYCKSIRTNTTTNSESELAKLDPKPIATTVKRRRKRRKRRNRKGNNEKKSFNSCNPTYQNQSHASTHPPPIPSILLHIPTPTDPTEKMSEPELYLSTSTNSYMFTHRHSNQWNQN